ncbi:hypothetical protein [Agrobacterium sp. LMR679]|uniref:hypothetical protein n=1 Tax=Agrobacterium sp. LMR679 TaxID=3014335 RepID=UPI0022AED659|nr:hypothetical protein [Agrobacterium sp. LMR679]MCZ4075132.1 hypothetical protein [Agrobacterium sp. LMR679]
MNTGAGGNSGAFLLEHFQEKWTPVFRPEMRQNKELECFRDSKKSEKTLTGQRIQPVDIGR